MKKVIFTLMMPFLSLTCGFSQTVEPYSRLTEYSTSGLENEIDVSTWPIYNILSYGTAADVTAAFENFFTQVTEPAIVYAPAGTYTITSAIYVRSNIVIRGDGAQQTIFQINTPSGAQFRDGFRLQGKMDKLPGECSPITADDTYTVSVTNAYSKGANTIDVAEPTYFSVGDNIEIEQDNIALEITEDAGWAAWCKGQIAVVVAINGNTITLDRTLTADYVGTIRARKFEAAENIGLESFTIETVSPSYNSNIGLEFAANCWIKCVESKMCDRDHIRIDRSRNIEISGCYVHDAHSHGAGGFGYGIRLSDHTGDCRVENNICRYLRHGLIIKEGANRNVFGYNYVREGYYSDGNHFPADISVHGHWAWLNLFEGNIVGRITISDAWGRSGEHNMLFRNRSERSWHIGILEGSDDQIVIGNEILEPYLRRSDGSYFSGDQHATEAPGYCGNNWCGGTPPYYGECVNRTCFTSKPDAEYLTIEEDPDVDNTIRYGNQNFFGFIDAPTTDLPNSYYLCTKPEFFTNGDAWPSIGPEFTLGSGTIPARIRWADYESSNDINDLFPDCFCKRNMAEDQLPEQFSICGPPPNILSTGLSTAGNAFEWYQNRELMAGEIGENLNVTSQGLYGVRVTNNGCTKMLCSEVGDEILVDLGEDQTLCNPTEFTLEPLVNGQGLDYQWSTGDTSSAITINEAGTYTVTVSSATCSAVSDEVIISTDMLTPINVDLPCGGGMANLTTVEGDDLRWYAESAGGTPIHTGSNYNVAVTSDTVFYAEENVSPFEFEVGPELNDLVPAYSSGSRNPNEYEDGRVRYRVEFSTNTEVILESVFVYLRSTNTNTHTIQLQVDDRLNNPVGVATPYLWTPPSTGYHLVEVPVNITIPAGKDYSLHAVGSTSGALQWRYFSDGGVYPYVDPDNLVQITRSYDNYCTNTDNPVTYFFDWQFSLPGQLCGRIPFYVNVDECTSPDCNGDPGGNASIDLCGVCSGGNTGVVPNSSCQDCNGDANGTAYTDVCGNCVGGNTGQTTVDTDSDGTPDCNDNCPNDPNKVDPGTCGCGIVDTDTDSDGFPDCIDQCPNDPIKNQPMDCGCGVVEGTCQDCNGDANGTAYTDVCGNCVGGNTGQTTVDTDSDGTPDCNDNCPNNPNKVDPGVCGCGIVDVDTDSDGFPDCIDQCPNDPNKVDPLSCGCGVAEGTCVDCNGDANGTAYTGVCGNCVGGNTGQTTVDTDSDGTPDCNDNCPNDPNKVDPLSCGCGVVEGTCQDCNGNPNGTAYTDVCGNCVGGNTGQTTVDTDSDGTPDCNDNCPNDPNKIDPGTCGCGIVDVDTDSDGFPDCIDQCPNDPIKNQPMDCGCGVVEGTCQDCNGDPFGTAYIDSCGICVEGNTGEIACLMDCNGEWGGAAVVNDCGQCVDTLLVGTDCRLIVANVFTPNNDGDHDAWIVQGLEQFPETIIEIYNRWGSMVYKNKGNDWGWDGKRDGELLPVATYYFILDLNNGEDPVTGSITLIY